MNLTIHVNVICCSFCQHNGLDIDPNGGAVAAISFNRSGRTGCKSEISRTSAGMTAKNRAVGFSVLEGTWRFLILSFLLE